MLSNKVAISYMGSLNVHFNELKLKQKCIPQAHYPHLKCSTPQHCKTAEEKLRRSERQLGGQKLRVGAGVTEGEQFEVTPQERVLHELKKSKSILLEI